MTSATSYITEGTKTNNDDDDDDDDDDEDEDDDDYDNDNVYSSCHEAQRKHFNRTIYPKIT